MTIDIPPGSPEFLTIGHVTRDEHPDGSFSIGGTVTYAALTAYRLGLEAAILTCADIRFSEALPAYLPGIKLIVRPSAETTTFANSYHEGFRIQYLRARGAPIQVEDIPAAWRDAPLVLLGPLAQELAPELVRLFSRRQGAIIAATPQGWLRRWDEHGRVWPTPWVDADVILPLLDVLILSHDDLLPFAEGSRADADAILMRWAAQVPLLVATDGRHGATLYQNGRAERFPAYVAREVDPTGAGDVFAAAFLTYLYRNGHPRAAVDFANCAASLSIEHQGTMGIPTLETVMQRIKEARS